MCDLCRRLPKLSTDQGLKLVAEAMRSGSNRLHLSEVLDLLLGTSDKLLAEDPELAEIWEKMRRE